MKGWLIVGIVLAALVGLIILSQGSSREVDTEAISQNQLGESENGITLTEILDFECPACAAYHPVMKVIREEYKDRVIFSARHHPLRAIHPSAQVAHQAAEAAAKQGKFWEMHDKLFEERNLWINDPLQETTIDSTAAIEEFARDLGLNIPQFKEDFRSDATNKTINADINWADRYRGAEKIETPTFFIQRSSDTDPERIPKTQFNAQDPDTFRTFLDDIIGVDDDSQSADEPENPEAADQQPASDPESPETN